MKSAYLSAIALTVAAWTAGQAFAADASTALSREQVQAELAQAVRTGDIVIDQETGLKANEIFPGSYPARAAVQGKTRDQVKAELAEAIRLGDVPVDGVTGLRMNQLVPGNYPAPATAQGKSRAEVQADLAKALRSGALPVNSGV